MTAPESQIVIVQIDSEWRVVNLETRWAIQRRDYSYKKWSRRWQTVAGSHLREVLAQKILSLTNTSFDVEAALAALPDVHAGFIIKPPSKNDDAYSNVIFLLGINWRVIQDRGIAQWTLQRRSRVRWNDVCFPRTRQEIELTLQRAGENLDDELKAALALVPLRCPIRR